MIKTVQVPEELVGQGGVITKGVDSLLVFPLKEWAKLVKALEGLGKADPEARRLFLFYTAYATEFGKEDRGIELSEDLQDHISGCDGIGKAYSISYGEGPFDTCCWTVKKTEE